MSSTKNYRIGCTGLLDSNNTFTEFFSGKQIKVFLILRHNFPLSKNLCLSRLVYRQFSKTVTNACVDVYLLLKWPEKMCSHSRRKKNSLRLLKIDDSPEILPD